MFRSSGVQVFLSRYARTINLQSKFFRCLGVQVLLLNLLNSSFAASEPTELQLCCIVLLIVCGCYVVSLGYICLVVYR